MRQVVQTAMKDVNNQKSHATDYAECPIPATHRRLAEAHLLWHQALSNYQEPDAFRANLNATIQTLRNVTFALQNEKHAIANFDEWYGRWQARLAADLDAKWLQKARTVVVHQGDLEMASFALVRLLTWKDTVLIESQVPSGAPTSLILSNLPLVELLKSSQIPTSDLRDAALEIERRWSVDALQGREILETLAGTYGLLSELVLDGHAQVNRLQCIPIAPAHPDFRSTHHRTGVLGCMVVGREQRIQRSKLSSGQSYEVINDSAPVSAADEKKAPKRYGLGKEQRTEAWQTSDPIVVAENILARAKRILKKDKYHARMMFIRDGQGTWHQVLLNAADRTEKHILVRVAASFMESVGADVVIDIAEAWILPASASLELEHHDMEDAPSRQEVLHLVVASLEGIRRTYITPFSRSVLGRIRLEETDQSDDAKYLHYLVPILEVWRRQMTKRPSDGKAALQFWTPDPLDTCFCGGPKRLSECCRAMLDEVRASDSITQDIQRALENGDTVRAEQLARASLAQYVIWIKQHTAPTRHVAGELHRDLIQLDVLALQSCVYQLRETFIANKHADAFAPALVQLSAVVGVPELAVRLMALAAESQWESGDVAGSVANLKSLGTLDRINDTRALVLITKLIPLPNDEVSTLLTRAVDVACGEHERVSTSLQLVRHLLSSGNGELALRELDSAIVDASVDTDNRSILAEALALRWEITRKAEDFLAAKTALEVLDPEQHWKRLASLLIDHGDYDEANAVLTKALQAGDVVAYLLAVDARLRLGQLDSARELFLVVPTENLSSDLLYPYAYTMGLVASMCGDQELKREAVSRLRKIVALNNPAMKPAKILLDALEDK